MINGNNQYGYGQGQGHGHGHNMFVRDYQQHQQQNIPFRGNDLLVSNQQMQNMYNNAQFHQHLQMARMKRLQKAKIMSNVQISDTELTNYVIGPMKVEKAPTQELESEHRNIESCYVITEKKNEKNKKSEYDSNPYLKQLWNKRTNQPYKRIMYKENWEKKIDKEDDLIVHTVTKKDKDKKKLKKTYKKLLKINKEDNKQIAEIYSTDNEMKHMKNFQYSHVYKYRLKHNAKNHEDMTKIYKEEQRKLHKEKNEIQSALTMLLNSDILPDEDKIALQKELAKSNDKMLKNKTYQLKSSDQVGKELENLKEILGEKEFGKLVKESDKEFQKKKKKAKKKDISDEIPVINIKKISIDDDITIPVINIKKIVIKDDINNDDKIDVPTIKLRKIPQE